MAPEVSEVGLTTELQGAGGFGKTTMAAWVCQRPELAERYPGGLLWVTLGQEVHGADLAERVNNLACVLSGQRPALTDPDAAGAELGRLLDERGDPVLLVVDDVWDALQLRPFRFGGRACSRLVTTRIPGLLPAGGRNILVDAMSADQARLLLTDGLTRLPPETADRLAAAAGHWPVLLNLLNGALRRRVDRGESALAAAEHVTRTLLADGPAAFDPARPAERSRAVAATVEASLMLLEPGDRGRYLDLAVFPEDVDIPYDMLALLWPGRPIDDFCEELVGLGLVADPGSTLPDRGWCCTMSFAPTCGRAAALLTARRCTGGSSLPPPGCCSHGSEASRGRGGRCRTALTTCGATCRTTWPRPPSMRNLPP